MLITSFPELYRRDESRSFVAGIRVHPDIDSIRLVYADWLEEHASDDPAFTSHYEARAAFIRAGCCNPGKSLTRLNRAESRWLDGNWERLFPTLMQVHGYHNKEAGEVVTSTPLLWRKGRQMRFDVYYRLLSRGPIDGWRHPEPRDYAGYFTAHLRRGFIDRIDWHGNLPYWTRLMPAIAKDDPFVCCRFPALAGAAVQHEDGTWIRRIYRDDVGPDVFGKLRPTLFFSQQRTPFRPHYASYMDRNQLKTLNMAARDLNRASREWAEVAPVRVSMTDAEFFGDTQSLADALSV